MRIRARDRCMLAKMSRQHATGRIYAIFMLEVKRWIVRASTEPARSRDHGTKGRRTKALRETPTHLDYPREGRSLFQAQGFRAERSCASSVTHAQSRRESIDCAKRYRVPVGNGQRQSHSRIARRKDLPVHSRFRRDNTRRFTEDIKRN